jgi:hypothetical protein
MTPCLVRAVAPNGKGCVVRKGSEEIEEPRGRGSLHLGPVALDETLPLTLILRAQRDLDELLGWSQLREPDIIKVT